MYKWCVNRIKDEDIADDVSQNFWILVWENPKILKLDENGSAKRFLLHLFSLRMIDYLKSASTRLLSMSKNNESLDFIADVLSYTHVYEEYELREFNEIINGIVADFPEMMQKIFTLVYREGYTLKETAGKLNINEKTAGYKSRACIATIVEKLKKADPDNPLLSGGGETMVLLLIVASFIK